MKTDDVIRIIERLERDLKELKQRVDEFESPRTWPSPNTTWPTIQPKVTMGCPICGIGADGKAYGYVCNRSDCPTRITC